MSFIRRRIEKEPLLSDTSLDQSVQTLLFQHSTQQTMLMSLQLPPNLSTDQRETFLQRRRKKKKEMEWKFPQPVPEISRLDRDSCSDSWNKSLKADGKKIKTIKRPSFLFFPKRKRERDRMNEIESFIDDSTFGLELPTAVPDETRAFASLLQIPYTTLPRDKGVVPTVPVVFSLLKLRIIDSNDTGRHIASNAMFTFELKYGTPETREICWKYEEIL